MEQSLWIFTGGVVGLLLGMTGGGGSLLAVPLLVFVHGLSAKQAVAVSLATVGVTAMWGAIRRWRQKLLDLRVGLIFALAGMAGAPVGSWIAGELSSDLLLTAFAILMIVVAIRMGLTAKRDSAVEHEARAFHPSTCEFEPSGEMRLDSRCAVVLVVVGALVGVLSGLFGVGGGFVIVPALILVTRMEIQRAIATSLFVVALIGLSGFVSHLWGSEIPAFAPLSLFVVGGIIGLEGGSWVARKLPAFRLRQVFSMVIVAVAALMLWNTLRL